jgi:methylated-DNA-protein-cysteine methyltransferase-like protein
MNKKATGSLYSAIYSLVGKIPSGYVATYGQIAREVGCTARTVGFAMAALPSGSDVPWQRVINAQGKISPRQDGEGNVLQRDLLQAEGLYFDQKGKINMEKHNWNITH